jgi:hypothetical protein
MPVASSPTDAKPNVDQPEPHPTSRIRIGAAPLASGRMPVTNATTAA